MALSRSMKPFLAKESMKRVNDSEKMGLLFTKQLLKLRKMMILVVMLNEHEQCLLPTKQKRVSKPTSRI